MVVFWLGSCVAQLADDIYNQSMASCGALCRHLWRYLLHYQSSSWLLQRICPSAPLWPIQSDVQRLGDRSTKGVGHWCPFGLATARVALSCPARHGQSMVALGCDWNVDFQRLA